METKKMTDAFGDKALSGQTPSGIQIMLEGIETTFQNCNQELAELQMGSCDYVFQSAAITEMTENMGYLQTYASVAPGYVFETLDQPLFENFKNNATETLSQIILDDLETENTIGMEEHYEVNTEGTIYTGKRVKTSLKFADFLGLPAVEAQEGMPVLENVETVNEFAFLFRADYDKMYYTDVEACIEAYLTAGEFNHTGYHPVKDVLSGLLDLTIVKPIIECIIGKDLITKEALTDGERAIKLAGACVDLFTFGSGILKLSGTDLIGKELWKAIGKLFSVEMTSSAAAYGVGYVCAELEMPPWAIWVASVATGCTVSAAGNKFLLKDMSGNVTEYTLEELQERLTKELPNGGTLNSSAAMKSSTGTGKVNHGGRIIGSDGPEFASNAGDGFGKLSGKSYNVTQEGIDRVKTHISSNGFDAYENTEMIKRLENALKNGEKISGADASFYMHELKESTLMQSGMPYEEAHRAALDFFEVSDFSVYHPDVIQMEPMEWNSAWKRFWNIKG